jgi:23S rRNA (adenine2503-C2)-methyltransferase
MVELNLPVKLSISLHSPFDDIRKQLMPNSLTMSELLDECDFYAKNIDKRITFEYILIDGITDTEQSISELVKIAKRYSAFINLISYNEVEGIDYKSSKKERLITSYLDKENIRYSFRYKRGQKIKGACGQLVWERKKNQQS